MKIFGFDVSGNYDYIDTPMVPNAATEPLFAKGGKTGCIVLHGITGTPANVRPTADALVRAGYTVVAPTLAGHGTTVRDFGKANENEWLATALGAYDKLKAEGCTRIIPVGLSLGGILAGEVAARKECAGAVLISAPLKMKPYLRCARLISPLFPYIRYENENRHPEDTDYDLYSRMIDGMDTRKLKDLQRLINDLNKRLGDIRCPVCAIWAGRDNKVDDVSPELLKRGLSQAVPLTEHLLPDSPHGSTYAHERHKVAALVVDFVNALADKEV
ncbi:MAG: alpha/beta fold hydrolase [Clostridia bacterium]|nr:alpha/beta fold hydrolase [Clostridia bacterium]